MTTRKTASKTKGMIFVQLRSCLMSMVNIPDKTNSGHLIKRWANEEALQVVLAMLSVLRFLNFNHACKEAIPGERMLYRQEVDTNLTVYLRPRQSKSKCQPVQIRKPGRILAVVCSIGVLARLPSESFNIFSDIV